MDHTACATAETLRWPTGGVVDTIDALLAGPPSAIDEPALLQYAEALRSWVSSPDGADGTRSIESLDDAALVAAGVARVFHRRRIVRWVASLEHAVPRNGSTGEITNARGRLPRSALTNASTAIVGVRQHAVELHGLEESLPKDGGPQGIVDPTGELVFFFICPHAAALGYTALSRSWSKISFNGDLLRTRVPRSSG